MRKGRLVLGLAGSALLLAACGSTSRANVTSSSSFRLSVLAPAVVAPVAKECAQRLTRRADGNAAPLLCRAGGLNTKAWAFYAPLGTDVMSLGRDASWSRVEVAMCFDERVEHATTAEEQQAARLADDYYGWSYLSQVNDFANTTCPSN